jgi:hypothetical protein
MKEKRCQPPKLENLGRHAVQITQIWWLAPFFPSVSARGMAIHPAARTSSQAHHQAAIQQLSGFLMYHTRHRWPDDVFSLADKSVSLKGIYRLSGHIMRRVSRNVGAKTCQPPNSENLGNHAVQIT